MQSPEEPQNVDAAMELRLPAVRGLSSSASDLLERFLRSQLGTDEVDALLPAILLATQEGLSNVIRHAYGGKGGRLTLQAEVNEQRVRIRLLDEGRPFDPSRIPNPDLATPREGGYGWFLIRSLVDEVRVASDEAGNAVEFDYTRSTGVPA